MLDLVIPLAGQVEEESSADVKVLVFSHSYPSESQPWITPFIGSFVEALSIRKGLEVHLLIPRTEVPMTPPGTRLHMFNPGRRDRISHKGIGADHR